MPGTCSHWVHTPLAGKVNETNELISHGPQRLDQQVHPLYLHRRNCRCRTKLIQTNASDGKQSDKRHVDLYSRPRRGLN